MKSMDNKKLSANSSQKKNRLSRWIVGIAMLPLIIVVLGLTPRQTDSNQSSEQPVSEAAISDGDHTGLTEPWYPTVTTGELISQR